jgi:hypothetical protein
MNTATIRRVRDRQQRPCPRHGRIRGLEAEGDRVDDDEHGQRALKGGRFDDATRRLAVALAGPGRGLRHLDTSLVCRRIRQRVC